MLDGQVQRQIAAGIMANDMNRAELHGLQEPVQKIHFALVVVILVVLGIAGQAASHAVRREDVKRFRQRRQHGSKIVGARRLAPVAAVDQQHRLALTHFVVARADAAYIREFGLEAANAAVGTGRGKHPRQARVAQYKRAQQYRREHSERQPSGAGPLAPDAKVPARSFTRAHRLLVLIVCSRSSLFA